MPQSVSIFHGVDNVHSDRFMTLKALIWFDYLLTFNGEIQEIWKRRLSWVTMLYHVNRYSLLVSSATLVIMQFNWPGLTDTVGGPAV